MRQALKVALLTVLFGRMLSPGPTVAIGPAKEVSNTGRVTIGVTGLGSAPRQTRDDPAGFRIAERHAEPVLKKEPPQKARDVLAAIQKRNGEPLPGYIGGRRFQNRERKLPQGSYREYDVNPKVRGRNRGAGRIVIEQRTGKAYYTDDHYETFIPMN